MPSAHGHAITNTAMARISAVAVSWPASSHPASVSAATPVTAGTKTLAARSTVRSICDRLFIAVCTDWIIWFSVLSAPTRVARISSTPLVARLPQITSSPGSLCA